MNRASGIGCISDDNDQEVIGFGWGGGRFCLGNCP